MAPGERGSWGKSGLPESDGAPVAARAPWFSHAEINLRAPQRLEFWEFPHSGLQGDIRHYNEPLTLCKAVQPQEKEGRDGEQEPADRSCEHSSWRVSGFDATHARGPD